MQGNILMPTTGKSIIDNPWCNHTKSIHKSEIFMNNNNNLVIFLNKREKIKQMILNFNIKMF